MWRGERDPCLHQNHVHRLRVKRNDVEPEFFMFWLHAAFVHLNLYRGVGNRTTIPNLSKAMVAALALPLPPLPEQREIARVLRTVQQAKEATERVIAATRQVKQSMLRYLFTYGPVPVSEAEGVPLAETEIGMMPNHWDVVPLDALIQDTQYGVSVRGARDAPVPLLRMNNIVDGRLALADVQRVDIPPAALARQRLTHGDLLFNRTNSIELVGKTAVFDREGEFVCASYLVRVQVRRQVADPVFVNYYINHAPVQARLKGLAARAVSQANISATRLRTLQFIRAPLGEQTKISSILKSVDSKLDREIARRDALATLFTALLHDLMTGKRRVGDFAAVPA
jgi:type I restriction enzyme S subunit